MKKALIVFLILAVAGGLFAQAGTLGGAPQGEVNSPSHYATFGRLGAPGWDDIISVTTYSGVPIKNFYGAFGFSRQASSGTAINSTTGTNGYFGYAQKIGKAYLGVYYGGNLFTGYYKPHYTEMSAEGGVPFASLDPANTSVWTDTAGSFKKFKVFNEDIELDSHSNDNRVAVLIGIANMGFKVSYASTHTSYKEDDVAINTFGAAADWDLDPNTPNTSEIKSTMFLKSLETAHGWIAPEFHWGFVKALTDNGLKPNVKVVLGWARNYAKGEEYTGSATVASRGEQIFWSQNFFQPSFNLDTENYNFWKSASGFSVGERFDYTLTLRSYNNDYSYLDRTINTAAKYETDSIKGFVGMDANGNTTYNEYSYNSHLLRLRTNAAFDEGPLSLRARLYTPITLTNQSITEFSEGTYVAPGTTSTSFQKSGKLAKDAETSMFTFEFAPYVELAARYKAFNNKLTISMGGKFSMGGIKWTTTETDYYATPAGAIDPDSRSKVANTSETEYKNEWGNWASELRAGFMFYLTDKFAVDLATGIYNGKVSVFEGGSGGLFNFGQVMAHLYF